VKGLDFFKARQKKDRILPPVIIYIFIHPHDQLVYIEEGNFKFSSNSHIIFDHQAGQHAIHGIPR